MKNILLANSIIISCLMGTVPCARGQQTARPPAANLPVAAAEPPEPGQPPLIAPSGGYNRHFAQAGGGAGFGAGGGGGFGGGGKGAFEFQDIFDGNGAGISWEGRPQSAGRPLIIRSLDIDEKSAATLEEDLKIMARILDKAVDSGHDESARKAMGITVFGAPGGRMRNLYVEGYGALFLLNVNFPLLAPPEKTEEPKAKEQTSSTWEETKNELYGGHFDREGASNYKSRGRAAEPYDAEKVEALQDSILKSLKNAAHIRKLKADDFVTIVITGSSGGRRIVTTLRSSASGTISKTDSEHMNVVTAGGGQGMPESTMTIRVKKSDVDSFSKEKMEFDDFKKKVKISIY